MAVINQHERQLAASAAETGALLDTLANGNDDRLWPRRWWPAMRFNQPGLAVGAHGGHGPIRYQITAYQPGRRVWFTFTGPKGFKGGHGFQVTAQGGTTQLTHTLKMTVHGLARITWPLVFRPLHNALIEDSLWQAEMSLKTPGEQPPPRPGWSRWVKFLRWVLARVG